MGLLLLFDVCASVSLLEVSKVSFLQSPPTQNVLHLPASEPGTQERLSPGSWQKFRGFKEIKRGLGTGKITSELGGYWPS